MNRNFKEWPNKVKWCSKEAAVMYQNDISRLYVLSFAVSQDTWQVQLHFLSLTQLVTHEIEDACYYLQIS